MEWLWCAPGIYPGQTKTRREKRLVWSSFNIQAHLLPWRREGLLGGHARRSQPVEASQRAGTVLAMLTWGGGLQDVGTWAAACPCVLSFHLRAPQHCRQRSSYRLHHRLFPAFYRDLSEKSSYLAYLKPSPTCESTCF